MNGFSSWSHCSSFVVLQTSVVCPVFESITVFAGRHLQVTVLAFSCLTTTQCSMSSAVGGGVWLRMGGGVAATGCFFAAQPARSRQNTSPVFLMPSVFALSRPLVDGNLGYLPRRGHPCEGGGSRRRLSTRCLECWRRRWGAHAVGGLPGWENSLGNLEKSFSLLLFIVMA